jgi:hypothetical protein
MKEQIEVGDEVRIADAAQPEYVGIKGIATFVDDRPMTSNGALWVYFSSTKYSGWMPSKYLVKVL